MFKGGVENQVIFSSVPLDDSGKFPFGVGRLDSGFDDVL